MEARGSRFFSVVVRSSVRGNETSINALPESIDPEVVYARIISNIAKGKLTEGEASDLIKKIIKRINMRSGKTDSVEDLAEAITFYKTEKTFYSEISDKVKKFLEGKGSKKLAESILEKYTKEVTQEYKGETLPCEDMFCVYIALAEAYLQTKKERIILRHVANKIAAETFFMYAFYKGYEVSNDTPYAIYIPKKVMKAFGKYYAEKKEFFTEMVDAVLRGEAPTPS